MGRNSVQQGVLDAMERREREKLKAAMEAAQDCPILPTSERDPTPQLPAEPDDNLSPQQRLAAAALVAGRTFAEAARAAGCGRRTLYGWRQQPAFQAAVERTSREALDVAVVRVRNMMLRATRVLHESMLNRLTSEANAFRIVSSQKLWATADRPLTASAPTPAATAVPPADAPASGDGGTSGTASG